MRRTGNRQAGALTAEHVARFALPEARRVAADVVDADFRQARACIDTSLAVRKLLRAHTGIAKAVECAVGVARAACGADAAAAAVRATILRRGEAATGAITGEARQRIARAHGEAAVRSRRVLAASPRAVARAIAPAAWRPIVEAIAVRIDPGRGVIASATRTGNGERRAARLTREIASRITAHAVGTMTGEALRVGGAGRAEHGFAHACRVARAATGAGIRIVLTGDRCADSRRGRRVAGLAHPAARDLAANPVDAVARIAARLRRAAVAADVVLPGVAIKGVAVGAAEKYDPAPRAIEDERLAVALARSGERHALPDRSVPFPSLLAEEQHRERARRVVGEHSAVDVSGVGIRGDGPRAAVPHPRVEQHAVRRKSAGDDDPLSSHVVCAGLGTTRWARTRRQAPSRSVPGPGFARVNESRPVAAAEHHGAVPCLVVVERVGVPRRRTSRRALRPARAVPLPSIVARDVTAAEQHRTGAIDVVGELRIVAPPRSGSRRQRPARAVPLPRVRKVDPASGASIEHYFVTCPVVDHRGLLAARRAAGRAKLPDYRRARLRAMRDGE